MSVDSPRIDTMPSGTAPLEHIGSYRLVRQLGAGGMGVVFEAVHTQIGRRAAIKILHHTFSTNPEVVARFLNEARAVNIVRHPGIVDIYEFGRLGTGEAYIIMEYLEGESLAERLKVSTEPPGLEVLPLFVQLAEALAAAHGKGIVHRDLKPDNIMLVPQPHKERQPPEAWPVRSTVKVLDFGIAKLMQPAEDGDPEVHTRSQVMMGTPAYMSPEQCLGAGGVDEKSDVYSLGVLLYRCLAGRLPFVCQAPGEYILAHMTRQPPPLRERVPGLPEELAALIHAMLAKAASERPSMGQVAGQLAQMQPGADGGQQSGQGQRVYGRSGVGPVALAGAAQGKSWLPALGVGLVVLGLSGLGVAWRSLRGPGPAQDGPQQEQPRPVVRAPEKAPVLKAPQQAPQQPDMQAGEAAVPVQQAGAGEVGPVDRQHSGQRAPGRAAPGPRKGTRQGGPGPGRTPKEREDVTNDKLPVVE